MTLPNSSRSPYFNSSETDVNTILSNQEFQEILQEYFQSNTMTLDEFLENLPRFMMENYGQDEDGYFDEQDNSIEEDDDDKEEMYLEGRLNEEENDSFMTAFLRSNQRNNQNDATQLLFRSLLAGRREINEIPLRTIMPQSPPPSPLGSNPLLQRYRTGPQLPQRPLRPTRLERRPSQLRNSTINTVNSFDPNAPDDCKSPYSMPVDIVPFDRNNDLRYTSEFMSRYGRTGHLRNIQASLNTSNASDLLADDFPER